jgi:peptidoglycan LD-endopeptidase LytH
MLRLVVLVAVLISATWLAREAGWLTIPVPLSPATPHQTYQRGLEATGVLDTTLGRAWLDASHNALHSPAQVTLPIIRKFRFDSFNPAAWSFLVPLKRGQRVEVQTRVESAAPAEAFVDIFSADEDSALGDVIGEHEHGALRAAEYDAEDDELVIVRVQPELLRDGTAVISLRAAPTLRFPVANARPDDLQSIFGDPRDAGRRQHEGVDIFAKRGTPVLSAAAGVVTRVAETRLGGRVVWVWNPARGLRLYYAHLDRQLVATGERVEAGDVLGTVGNTGNARTTPPHLHFGIYERRRGAIDPYWFIAPPLGATPMSAHR